VGLYQKRPKPCPLMRGKGCLWQSKLNSIFQIPRGQVTLVKVSEETKKLESAKIIKGE
jgi:hypothetical protein